MSNTTYNGWTNRETWLVNIWFNPESRDDVESARAYMDELYEQVPEGIMRDMLDLSAINWDELADKFDDEATDETEESTD
jgi:hypothetical protein